MANVKTNQYTTSEFNVAAYLYMRNIRPERYSKEEGRGTLYYERTANLESALVDYMQKCGTCGIAFSEVASAHSTARKMLIDGNIGTKSEDRKRGGNR